MKTAPKPHNESERLFALQQYQVLDTAAEKEFDDLVKLAAQICQTPISLISLVDADRQWFKAKHGLDADQTPRDHAFCAHTLPKEDNQILEVENALEDERFHDNPLVTQDPNIRFYAGMPLETPDGFKLGTLCVIDTAPRKLNDEQRFALKVLSEQVMKLFEERLKLKELERVSDWLDKRTSELNERNHELERRASREQALNNILSTSLQYLGDLDSFLKTVINDLSKVSFLKFLPGIGIFIRDEAGKFKLRAHQDLVPEVQKKCATIESGECLCGLAIQKKKVQYAACLDDRHTNRYKGIQEHGHYNVPILYEEEALGALVVHLPAGHKKQADEVEFLENIAAIIANMVYASEAEKKLKEQNQQLIETKEELSMNIEELQTTQEDLQKQQEKLKKTLAENVSINYALNSSGIVSITDLKGTILHVNDVFCRISGFTRKELIGKNQNIVNSGYHPKEFWKSMWRDIGTGHTWRGEVRNKKKSGEFYWVDAVVNPMFDEKQRIYRYLSIRYLITDKKETEVRLHKTNSDLTASINYAQRIQQTILPSTSRMQKLLPDSFVLFKPRDVVSGDFYFLAEIDQKIVLAVLDCTGHGVPGAFMSLIGYNVLTDIAFKQRITEPDQILEALHQGVNFLLHQKKSKNRDGMDAALVVIDKKQRQLSFAGAKNPLLYVQDGVLHKLRGDQLSIGGYQQNRKAFSKKTIWLDTPTTIYLASDGYQDQFGGPEGRKFMSKQLQRLLERIHAQPLNEQRNLLDKTIEDWRAANNEKQTDDILLIGARL